MSDAVTVIDGQTAGSGGGTVSGSYNIQHPGQRDRVGYAVVIEADGNGGNLDLDVLVTYDSLTGDVDVGNTYTGLDATTNHVAKYVESRGATTLEITVTNQGASNSDVSVYVVPYRE